MVGPEKMAIAVARKHRKLRESLLRPVLELLSRNPDLKRWLDTFIANAVLAAAVEQSHQAIRTGKSEILVLLPAKTVAKQAHQALAPSVRTVMPLDMTEFIVEHILSSSGYEVVDGTLHYSQSFENVPLETPPAAEVVPDLGPLKPEPPMLTDRSTDGPTDPGPGHSDPPPPDPGAADPSSTSPGPARRPKPRRGA